jgi:hypothetical protein
MLRSIVRFNLFNQKTFKTHKKMKNLFKISVLVFFLFTQYTIAQKNYDTYKSSLSDAVYEIKISVKSPTKYELYIDMFSLDKLSQNGGIVLNEKELSVFIENLQNARLKYQEWKKVSIENELTEAEKTMTFSAKSSAYFYYGNWHYSFNAKLSFQYKIIAQTHYLLVRTGKIYSSSNRFTTHDGFVFAFSSVEEIDDFIKLFDTEKLSEFASRPSEKDLFKD